MYKLGEKMSRQNRNPRLQIKENCKSNFYKIVKAKTSERIYIKKQILFTNF